MLLQMDRLPLGCLIDLQEHIVMVIISGPGLGFDLLSVIGPAVFRLSVDGIDTAPGLPFCLIQPSPFFLGELFIGD